VAENFYLLFSTWESEEEEGRSREREREEEEEDERDSLESDEYFLFFLRFFLDFRFLLLFFSIFYYL
jgi:hypothetical protein